MTLQRIIEPAQVPAGKYEGWYWLSNAQKPVMLRGESFDNELLKAGKLPFVLEANLHDRDKNVSISISAPDGQPVVTLTDLSELKDEDTIKRTYIAHRLPEDGLRISAIEIWLPQSMPQMDNMQTRQPVALVFTGFENNHNQNKNEQAK